MGKTILLADKSITIQKIVELTFADEDFAIRCVNDGHTALEMISQIQPSIVLADISLPGVSGYDLCSTLRTDPSFSAFSNIPVILLAGIYETMDEERAKQVEDRVKEVRANDYLSKPFDSQLLTEKVKSFLSRSSSDSVDDTSPGDFARVEPPSVSGDDTGSFSTGDTLYPPPDDTEKTMMIQGPPIFANSMFSDKSPLEDSPAEDLMGSSNTVKISGADLEAARAAYARIGSEQDMMSPDSGDSSPFGVESTMSMKVTSTDMSGSVDVAGVTEEPFGNVFEESTAKWRLTPLAEEDNPFGLPEQEMPVPPSPSPVPEETVTIQEAAEPVMTFEVVRTEPEFDTASFQRETIVDNSPVIENETTPEPLSTITMESPVRTTEVDLEAQSTLEDTWPGRRLDVSTIVETVRAEVMEEDTSGITVPEVMDELDSKPSELAEDTADTLTKPLAESELENAAPVLSSYGPAEITDELIDRIVEKVIARLSDRVVSDIVWQVVPDLAEKMIRRELEKIQANEE